MTERDWDTWMAFEEIIDPGHWCAACGVEQPAEQSCGECYDMKSVLDDAVDWTWHRLTRNDRRDIYWLWRS